MAQYEMLYVSRDGNQVDIDLMDFFTLEGYNVTSVLEDDFKAEGSVYATEAGYVGYDVLFVSESIGSSSANNFASAGFPIPSVVTEGFVAKASRWGLLADDSDTFFKQASSATLTADVLNLVITDNSHWITQSFETDDILAWATASDPTKLGVTSFDLSADIPAAIPLAEYLFDMGDLSAVWAIPDGAVMRENDTLPSMVVLGLIQTDVGQAFTGDFQLFLVDCIRWVTGDYPTAVKPSPALKRVLSAPNPTGGLTELRYSQDERAEVEVKVYDHSGRTVLTLPQGTLEAGFQVLSLDLSGLSPGAYIYEIRSGQEQLRGRIIRK